MRRPVRERSRLSESTANAFPPPPAAARSRASARAVLIAASPGPGRQAARSTPSDPWAQATSDIPADSDVRFGVLPNGMRYAILRNATPPGQASLRLRIDAGSLMESDDQQGLAHFLEHMAFNGSTNIPENDMTTNLERLGLAFGADTNAFTSFDQTTYMLKLPRTTDEVVDASLRFLREVASEAPVGLRRRRRRTRRDRGRGAHRATRPACARSRPCWPFIAPGQRLSDRLPIGDLNIIRTAPRERFVDFYQRLLPPGARHPDRRRRLRRRRDGGQDPGAPSATGPTPPPMAPSPIWAQIARVRPETLIHGRAGRPVARPRSSGPCPTTSTRHRRRAPQGPGPQPRPCRC